jgi:hypothetical protein
MPSANYYRAQAQLLHSLSLTASDPELAERYRVRAREYLLLSAEASETAMRRVLDRALDGFNDQQLRKA